MEAKLIKKLIITLTDFVGKHNILDNNKPLINEKALAEIYNLYYTKLNEPKYLNLAWPLLSAFNLNNPDNSLINIAMPSAVSFYYLHLLKPGNKYKVTGQFPKNSESFQTNIQQYTTSGNPLPGGIFLDSRYQGVKPFILEFEPKQDNFLMLRIYLNTNELDDVPNNWLCEIYKNCEKLSLPSFNQRKEISDIITPKGINLIEQFSDSSVTFNDFMAFYLPCNQGDGLFPDISHYYLSSALGDNVQAIRIFGENLKSDDPYIVYTDFMGVNSLSTQTLCAIPFFELNEEYEFIICNHDYKVPKKYENLNILRFNENVKNNEREIVFRMINYASDEEDPFVKYIHSSDCKTLNAFETKKLLGYLYPNIEILE
tara:strand:- start:748 stop:1860 length:1113 start_codon:yes stop_codon:yes gene_type:complete